MDENPQKTITIEVTANKLSALVKSADRPITLAELETALKDQGVIHGIHHNKLRNACKGENPICNVVAATGKPPKPGKNASFKFHFQTRIKVGEFTDDTGKLDFKKRGLLQNVKAGDLIAEKIPPKPGENGMNVYGDPIPHQPGEDKNLVSQGNIILSEDGLNYYAKIDGAVCLSADAKIGVFKAYTIDGDLGYSTGHITMDGSLNIKGWIRSGFAARASGEIFVGEGVEDALISAGANLEVNGGILGSLNKLIRAGGGVVAKFLESAHLFAGGDVQVQESAIRCRIICKGRFKHTGNRGGIIGGSVAAEQGVEAAELGSKGAAKTVVETGVNPEVKHQITKLLKELEIIDRHEKKIQHRFKWLSGKSRITGLKPKEAADLGRIRKLKREAVRQKAKLEKLKEKFASMALRRPSQVKVRRAVYEGVTVIVNGYPYVVEKQINKAGAFVFDTDEWKVKYIE